MKLDLEFKVVCENKGNINTTKIDIDKNIKIVDVLTVLKKTEKMLTDLIMKNVKSEKEIKDIKFKDCKNK